jgi:methyl-accepting chemotaxis protein
MNDVTKLYNKMCLTLEKGIEDVEKFEDGNKSAGTRIRKNMQDVKNLAQQIRVEVQEMKNAVAA